MRKSFEDLTIADDFMFCKIMEHESLCRPFLEMLFTVNIGKITYLSSQNGVITNSAAKTVRVDILVKDDAGTSYDIEMSFSDRHPCLSENTSFALQQNIAATDRMSVVPSSSQFFGRKTGSSRMCKDENS